ncbi:MAG: type II secretion system secretin GspD [Deltaproteobacteria bacterium]|nr:type II secretion system secretin GspD [Deltaproteobacteria bacterium]
MIKSWRLRIPAGYCWVAIFLMLLLFSEMPVAAKEKGDSQTQKPSEGAAVSNGLISIDFNNVDIAVLIKFISDLTGKNMVVDQRVTGKVTIISPDKITVAEAYKVFESVLEVYGFTAIDSGGLVKIVPLSEARTRGIDTLTRESSGSSDDRIVTQVIPLKYANAVLISRLFVPLISKSSVLMAYPPTNTLIITDLHSNIQRLLRMIKAIDVSSSGQEISVFVLRYAAASQVVRLLDSIFQTAAKAGKEDSDAGVRVFADDRTNALVVMAGEEHTQKIRNLIQELDKETPKGNEKLRVYYLENAKAEDLVKVLQDMPRKADGAPEKDKAVAPSILSEKVKITADKATNSLVIMAEKSEYAALEEIIRLLDIPRAMVYIECLIMEVNVNKDFNIGTEWITMGTTSIDGRSAAFGGGFSGAGAYPNVTGMISPTTGVGTLPTGFSLGILSETLNIGGIQFPGLAAVVQAYKKDKDVNILSTPQILTTDNEEASIMVGKNVPYQTKSGSTGTLESFNTYEYRDVGITLKITPQISRDRLVRLNITQEVTKLDQTGSIAITNDTLNRPTTLKRTITTTVLVQDANTVVIGGLIDDSLSMTEYKVPCIGDVPGLGWLFKSRAKNREKTNLFVFMTPHVVSQPQEGEAIYRSKQDQMDRIRKKAESDSPESIKD